MALLRRRSRSVDDAPSAVTAAAQRIEVSPERRAELNFKRAEDWQRRAWEFYDTVGEAGYAANYMGNAIGRLRMYPAVQPDPQGRPEPLNDPPQGARPAEGDRPAIEADDYSQQDVDACYEALERLRSPLGGRSELQRRLGVNWFVAGDAFLIGEQPEDAPESWEVYSSEQVKVDWDRRQTVRGRDNVDHEVPLITLLAPGSTSQGRDLPPEVSVHRLWRPHPRYHQWADAPYRRALGILEELDIATRATIGSLRSRLHGPGVWFLPQTVVNRPSPQQPNRTQDSQAKRTKGFVKDLVDVTSRAIDDPASAGAQIPYVVGVPDDIWEKVDAGKQLVQWDRTVDEQTAALRQELLGRFAATVDLPPEVIMGKADLNHWSAWNVDDEAYAAHIEPFAAMIFEALTYAYLRPMLTAAGVQDVERFCLWFDATDLVSDPDETDKVKWSHERLLISNETARQRIGFTEDDAPSEEELADRIEIAQALAGRTPTPTSDRPAPQQQPRELGPGQPSDGEGPPPAEQPQQPETPAALVASAKDRALATLGTRLANLDRGLLLESHTRADQAMRRALERANARLKSLAMRSGTTRALRDQLAGLAPDAYEVGPALGEALILTLASEKGGDSAAGLFAGAFDPYTEWWDERTGRTQNAMLGSIDTAGDLSEDQLAEHAAQDDRDRSAGRALMDVALLALASRLLINPTHDGGEVGEHGGTLVPMGLVRGPLARAGGGGEKAYSLLTGSHYVRIFGDALVEVSGWRWDYGDQASRFRPFAPHVDLDGFFFADADDDELGNAAGGFPYTSHYWPGDHADCQCTASPEFRRVLATSRFVHQPSETATAAS